MITDTASLAAFCKRLATAPYVTVDTEFMREKTYWPVLCLVQVAGGGSGGDAAVIDALAKGIDLKPLFGLLLDTKILKVFHAGRQDLEIFFHLSGYVPTPIFDSQVAAMVCGFGEQVSYEVLAAKLAKARVDKSSRFTDWSRRPLSERQISYALSDVTHLRSVYEKLQLKLNGNGRTSWLEEEMAVLTAPETYDLDPALAFRRIKSRSANRQFLAVLRELAAWREKEAQRRDLPRNRVLRDEPLVGIAHHLPSTAAELARTRGFGHRLAEGPPGAALLRAVKRGLEVPEEDCPEVRIKSALPRGLGPIVELLKVLMKMKCEENGVAQKLLASSADIELIAAYGEEAQVPALHGWRRQVFGEEALRLRSGDTALAIRNRKLVLLDQETGSDS